MDTRFTELLASFLKYLHGQELTESSVLRELGLDSMQSIELLFAVEDTFGVALADDDLNDATFATAGTPWSAIEAAQDATSAAAEAA